MAEIRIFADDLFELQPWHAFAFMGCCGPGFADCLYFVDLLNIFPLLVKMHTFSLPVLQTNQCKILHFEFSS